MSDMSGEAARWNHHPGRVRNNPLFDWPPRPMAVLRWYAAYWLTISTVTLTAAFSLVVYFALLPPQEAMQGLAPGWMVRVWLANFVPQVICAGGLHMWLYHWRAQAQETKYDARDLARDNGTYTFRDQVRDNMFWTLVSGVTL